MHKSAISLGHIADVPEFGMKAVQHEGRQILLVRNGERITAIEGTCPHAGAPLVEGVLCGAKIICPWHKAAFSVENGECLAPPAVDALQAFPLHCREGEIFLAPEVEKPSAEPVADIRQFAIIGAGAAGFSAAQCLRREGFAGGIRLIDLATALPYDRTILSKSAMAGSKADEKTPLQDEAFYHRHGIERYHAKVEKLDIKTKQITFDNGLTQDCDAIFIATGGTPRPLPFSGARSNRVFTLRSTGDAARIAAAAEDARHAVIIGTGFIGMEAAAGLRERGLQVTVIGQESVPFEKQLGPKIGAVLQRLHEKKGVKFLLGHKISHIETGKAGATVHLKEGDIIHADLIVAGLGVVPATGFVEECFKQKDGGLTVDETLKLTEGIYAGGDIAAFPRGADGGRVRVEHWRVAEQHGRIAALNMLGKPMAFRATPYFWTIHFMQRLDYVGHASGDDEVIIRGDVETQKFIAYYLRGGTVAAAAGMNQDQDMAAIIELMDMRQGWSTDELHPPGSAPQAVLRAQIRHMP
jgi:apoptosis-inducing factor 3